MSAREQETLARRLYRIARRGTMVSPAVHQLHIVPFYSAMPAIQDGFRHLAGWLWMDRKHVLKGARL